MGFGGRSRQLAGLWVTGSYAEAHILLCFNLAQLWGESGEEEDVKQRERDGTGLCLLSSHS